MPGHVIHLAIANQYLEKHKDKKENYNEFIKGVMFPDSIKDKSKTHYGKVSSQSNINEFLKENNITRSFERGYFLHLLTDYLFYNKYIDEFSKSMYDDYDILNKDLMKKYEVTLPEDVKNQVLFKEDAELTHLDMNLVDNIIKEISDLDIDDIAKETIENPDKWTAFRTINYK